jgi:hypothetical protein
MNNQHWQHTVQTFRKERDERVRANPRHWLAMSRLFVLEESDNPFGSADANKILPPGM